MFKAATGLDDGAVAQFHPEAEKLFNSVEEATAYLVVAEVVSRELH